MILQPEGSKLLVKPDSVKEKTKGGIYLPEQAKQSEEYNTNKGIILAIGPTVDLLFKKDRKAKVGDRIIFARYGGLIIKEDGQEDLRILNDEDVVCLIEKD